MYLYMDTKILNYFLIFAIAILIFLNILANNRTETFQINKINKDISKSLDKSSSSSSSSSKNSNESQSPSPNKLKDMMEALSNSEALCDELEKRQENKDLLQQYEINKNTIQELDNQRRRIEELRRVLNQLRKEKAQRDVVVNKCKAKTQAELNNDYTIVKKLSNKGLLKDSSVKVNLNVSDQLKRNLSSIKRSSNSNSENNNNNNLETNNNSRFSRVNKNTINSSTSTSRLSSPKRSSNRCRSVDSDKYIHADNIRGKCVGCNVDKLLEKNAFLKKDFS